MTISGNKNFFIKQIYKPCPTYEKLKDKKTLVNFIARGTKSKSSIWIKNKEQSLSSMGLKQTTDTMCLWLQTEIEHHIPNMILEFTFMVQEMVAEINPDCLLVYSFPKLTYSSGIHRIQMIIAGATKIQKEVSQAKQIFLPKQTKYEQRCRLEALLAEKERLKKGENDL